MTVRSPSSWIPGRGSELPAIFLFERGTENPASAKGAPGCKKLVNDFLISFLQVRAIRRLPACLLPVRNPVEGLGEQGVVAGRADACGGLLPA